MCMKQKRMATLCFLFVMMLFALSSCGSYELSVPSRDLPPLNPNPLRETVLPTNAAASYRTFEDFLQLFEIFPQAYINENTIIPGGVIAVSLVEVGSILNANFTGTLNPYEVISAADRTVSEMILPNLLATDAYGRFILGPHHHGPVIMDINIDEQTLTLRMRDDVHIHWHDGALLTLDDILFAYYYVAHPARRSNWITPNDTDTIFLYLIDGLPEFHRGEVPYISGLLLSDDERTLTIRFTQLLPMVMYGGILGVPLPRHHFADLPIEAIAQDIRSSIDMLGFGPFVFYRFNHMANVIQLNANEHYWQGRPYLDSVHLITSIGNLMTGDLFMRDLFDVAYVMNTSMIQDMDRFIVLGDVAATQDILMLHHNASIWGLNAFATAANNGRFVFTTLQYVDDGPINDPAFRRALVYAINNQRIAQYFSQGLTFPAVSGLHPVHASQWIAADASYFSSFDIGIANALLDNLGFTWQGDYRLDRRGEILALNLALAQTPHAQSIFEMLREDFKHIGISLRLFRPADINEGVSAWWRPEHLIDQITQDMNIEPIHLSFLQMPVNPVPFPSLQWSNNRMQNFTGFTADGLNDFLVRFEGDATFEEDQLAHLFASWDEFFNEYVPAIPLTWTLSLQAVHERVANWTRVHGRYHDHAFAWHRVGITSQ